jgi:acetyltransferase-like isoleucine patch superfamily enzyme/glycosyltransferase involved in cell wall biosynthesis
MEKSETVEIQKEIFKGGSKLKKYQSLIIGKKNIGLLLKYELIVGLMSWVPGAWGLLLRSKFYPRILGRVGRNVTFGTGVVFRHPKKIIIGDNVIIDDNCVLDAKGSNNRGIVIGNGVFLGRNTILNCKNGDIVLKDNVNVGFNCMIFSASEVHVGENYLLAAYCYLVGGTHMFDNPSIPVLHQDRSSKGIRLEPGGWLGAHVTVFDGVHIGKNVVVGAGSVVNQDIRDYAVAAGSPVRVIKDRKPKMSSNTISENNTKKDKRILYISMYDPHVPYTGAGVRGAQFVNYLARHFDIDLVYMKGSGHSGNPELEKKFANRIQGVNNVISVPFSQKGYFLFSHDLYRASVKFIQENRYDYIVADYGLGAKYGYKLSRKFDIPFIYCSHNIEFRQYLGKAKKDFRRWPLIPYVYSVEKKGCKRSKILVPISESDAKFYTKWCSPDKMIIIPQCFDDTEYNPFYEPIKNDPKIVLFFGNYNISTNREAVEATYHHIVNDVVKKIPNIKFQFVGANPPQQFVHPNIEFTGFVDSMIPYIKKADLVISPILKGWGMPTKIIESLACGKHVIATETGARSVPRNYKRLTICQIQDFADNICKALIEDRPVDPCDFENLKMEFLWEKRLSNLRDRINNTFV